jgi:hypothetical protein
VSTPISLGVSTVDPDASLAAGFAVLDVHEVVDESGPRFSLSGACCCHELPYTAPSRHGRPPKLELGTLISKDTGESPARTALRLASWSRTKTELVAWLTAIQQRHSDQLTLIIRDNTDFGIPWELFRLPPDARHGTPGEWLGALVSVVRCTVGQGPAGRDPRPDCSGGVMAYVAEGAMLADQPLMRTLDAEVLDTLWELIDQLDQDGHPLALVYIACHGEYGPTIFDFTLDEQDRVSVADVDTRTLRRLAEYGGLVFANACHSGRLINDPELNDGVLRGFADAFLRGGASGFLGTIGAVSESQARRAARQILARLGADRRTPVPVMLRDYRRELVRTAAGEGLARARDEDAARQLLRFFYAFMYVYYGSPETVITLRGRAGAYRPSAPGPGRAQPGGNGDGGTNA